MLPNSYVALDIETTGLSAKTDKIIEIAAVKVLDGQIAEKKSTLVNPHQVLNDGVRELTGIDDSMLQDAPNIGDVIGEYVEFCEGLPLLGHNIRFDYSFLKHAAVNHSLDFEKEAIDTLKLCRLFMPAKMHKNLSHACQFFHVRQTAAHRAMGDAMAAHELYQVLARQYGETDAEAFTPVRLIYKSKKEQPATKRQKEVLQELIKYHRINLTVQTDYLSRSEASRLTDQIISRYGRMWKRPDGCAGHNSSTDEKE